MATIHISEAEAARDFSGVIARIREGHEIAIDDHQGTIAVVRQPEPKSASIEDTIRRLEAIEARRGEPLIIDKDFADDLEEIIRLRETRPRRTYEWD